MRFAQCFLIVAIIINVQLMDINVLPTSNAQHCEKIMLRLFIIHEIFIKRNL